MKFKIIWNEETLNKFKNCKIKEQIKKHSLDKLNYLFSLVLEPTDKRRSLREVAQDIKNYEVMRLFGSSHNQFFKVIEWKGGLKNDN